MLLKFTNAKPDVGKISVPSGAVVRIKMIFVKHVGGQRIAGAILNACAIYQPFVIERNGFAIVVDGYDSSAFGEFVLDIIAETEIEPTVMVPR